MTVKQKVAAKEIVENGRTASAAMRIAGYSPGTMVDPGKLTRSKGFIEVMQEMGITKEHLAQVLQEGLKANRVISAKIVGKNADEQTDDFIEVPDHPTRHKFLETAIKVNGYAEQEEGKGNVYNTQVNISDKTPRGAAMVESFTQYMLDTTTIKEISSEEDTTEQD